jgi:hypothetical protein
MGRACSTYGGEEENICDLVGKREGKRPLRKTRRRREDNIIIDVREIGWDDTDWIHLAQDRDHCKALVNTVMNFVCHKMMGNSRVGERLAVSQEGFSSIELVWLFYISLSNTWVMER